MANNEMNDDILIGYYKSGLQGHPLPTYVEAKSPQHQFWQLGCKHRQEIDDLNGKVKRRGRRASQYGGRRHNRS
jgi:hypothetical protein